MCPAKRFPIAIVLLMCSVISPAKEHPGQTVVWPESGAPVLRFSFGKFREIGSIGGQRSYMTDTTVENLWSKPISSATFSLYLFDKNRVRIGDGWISLNHVGPGETVKFSTTIAASGDPVSLSVMATSLPRELQPKMPPKKISITVNSVPQGALLTVDGIQSGDTPRMVDLSIGKHMLEFSKDGFNAGKFPLEVGPDDVSGGSVSYELGSSAHDTIELRDGTVLSGDLESISGMNVVVKVGGVSQQINRNQIKRILLVVRDTANQ